MAFLKRIVGHACLSNCIVSTRTRRSREGGACGAESGAALWATTPAVNPNSGPERKSSARVLSRSKARYLVDAAGSRSKLASGLALRSCRRPSHSPEVRCRSGRVLIAAPSDRVSRVFVRLR